MYNDFSIENVYTVYSKNRVVIETNFTINEKSVNHDTVRLIRMSDQSVDYYKLKTDKNRIMIVIDRSLEKDEDFMLIINNVEDKLERRLSSTFNKKIKFEPAYKKMLSVSTPRQNETLRSRDVDINLEVMSETDEDTNYRIEVSKDIAFFDIKETLLTDELSVIMSLKEEGQFYVRARAESESGDNFGLWSKVISFNISTSERKYEYADDRFLDDFVFSDELFVDEVVPLEVVYRTPNLTTEPCFMLEINKNIVFKPNEDKITKFIKSCSYQDKKKFITKSMMMVEKEDKNIIKIYHTQYDFKKNHIYEFILPELDLEDGSKLKLASIKYITEQDDCLIDIEDIKQSLYQLKIEDECIVGHIKNVSGIANYWAKKPDNNFKIQLNRQNIKEEYYQFYMFIKYKVLYEVLLETYIYLATNPTKIKDVLSDLSREEEWDLKYLKDLLDDYQKEADEWLEAIVTITADPQAAVRGKYAYAIDYKYIKPYHKYPYGVYRGGYDTGRKGTFR